MLLPLLYYSEIREIEKNKSIYNAITFLQTDVHIEKFCHSRNSNGYRNWRQQISICYILDHIRSVIGVFLSLLFHAFLALIWEGILQFISLFLKIQLWNDQSHCSKVDYYNQLTSIYMKFNAKNKRL